MKILKDEGSFKIVTKKNILRHQLITIEEAGRVCYQSEKGKITMKTANKFIRKLIKRGHESVLEHGILTVKFNKVSRGFTHEMVRHRLCAFSQESTRYVDYAEEKDDVDLDRCQIQCVVPPHRDENAKVMLEDGREMSIVDMLAEYEKFYRALRRSGWLPQDARQILPIAIKSQIVVSADFREWRHIFAMRTQKAAHWEIRGMMCNLLKRMKQIIPVVFEDFEEAGLDSNGLCYFKQS